MDGGIAEFVKVLIKSLVRLPSEMSYGVGALVEPLWQDAEFDSWVKKRTPLGWWRRPEEEDIVSMAVFIASPATDLLC